MVGEPRRDKKRATNSDERYADEHLGRTAPFRPQQATACSPLSAPLRGARLRPRGLFGHFAPRIPGGVVITGGVSDLHRPLFLPIRGATVYFLLGENVLSLKDCAEVLKRNPQHSGVLSGYGRSYVRKGDLERTLDDFGRALTINPNMEGVRNSIALIERILVERRRKFI